MARLLEPADFGMMAMAGVILRFGTYFAQMGVGSALIQKKEVSDEDVRASFTSAFSLGMLFTIAVCFCAPLATYIFDNEKIVPIIQVMALSFFITGLSTTAISLLRRNLAFRSLAVTEVFSYVTWIRINWYSAGIQWLWCVESCCRSFKPKRISGNFVLSFLSTSAFFHFSLEILQTSLFLRQPCFYYKFSLNFLGQILIRLR